MKNQTQDPVQVKMQSGNVKFKAMQNTYYNTSYLLKTTPVRQNPVSKTVPFLTMESNSSKSVPYSFLYSEPAGTQAEKQKENVVDDVTLFKSLIANRPSLSWIVSPDGT